MNDYLTGLTPSRPPLLQGKDREDVAADLRTLKFDLDLFKAGLWMLSEYETRKLELSVLRILTHQEINHPQARINRKAIKRPAAEIKAAAKLS